MSNESKLLTVLTEQIEHCKAQDFTDAEIAQAVIDATADWFEDVFNQIGMSPVVIPDLLRWQAHQHEYLD
jgi:hypothetical protein